jgi:hypothetical protein
MLLRSTVRAQLAAVPLAPVLRPVDECSGAWRGGTGSEASELVVIVESRPDGTALVRIPGNDGHFVVKGEGPVYTDNGLIVFIAPDVVNWQERLEVLHASGGYRTTEDFVAAICGAID